MVIAVADRLSRCSTALGRQQQQQRQVQRLVGRVAAETAVPSADRVVAGGSHQRRRRRSSRRGSAWWLSSSVVLRHSEGWCSQRGRWNSTSSRFIFVRTINTTTNSNVFA